MRIEKVPVYASTADEGAPSCAQGLLSVFPLANALGLLPQTNFGITGDANITRDGRYLLRGAATFITFDNNTTYTMASHTFKAGRFTVELPAAKPQHQRCAIRRAVRQS